MTSTTISVAICTLTRPASLALTLAALAKGQRKPDEVILVDQSGSPLGDADRESLAHGLRLIHVPMAGRGLSRAQNLAVARANGDIVAVTDDDCIPDSEWLSVAEREFDHPDGLDLLTGRILPLPVEGDKVAALSSRTYPHRRILDRRVLPWDMGSGGNFAVRRTAYLAVGGNDERLGSGTPARAGNDIDLFWRLVTKGYRGVYEPSFLILHERATEAELEDRRDGYGRGVGAAVTAWTLRNDRRAPWVAAHWLKMRARLAAGAAYHRRWPTVRREGAILAGTAKGVEHARRQTRTLPTAELSLGSVPPLRGTVAFLSPHCDDVVMSLGATISALVRGGGNARIVTVMSGETRELPTGQWDIDSGFRSPAEATRARTDEDARASEILGAQLVLLGETDNQYPQIFSDDELHARILDSVAGADVVVVPGFPLTNPDHRRLHDLVVSRGLGGLPVRLYLEQPYASWIPVKPLSLTIGFYGSIVQELTWGPAVPTDDTDQSRKMAAIAAYTSQLPLLARPSSLPGTTATAGTFIRQARRWRRTGELLTANMPERHAP